MLFDIKRIEIHSLKEFMKEYFMIVLGILTALAMEHLVISIHDHHAAEASRARVVAEIRSNIAEVQVAVATNDKRLAQMHDMVHALRTELHSGVAKDVVLAHIKDRLNKNFSVGVEVPTLRHEAWDVVVADQSLTHIDTASLNGFASAYAQQRDAAVESLIIPTSNAMSRLLDSFTDLEFDKADPVELLKELNAVIAMVESTQGNLRELNRSLFKALPATDKSS
jgi:hypothetical protein